jgi:hypothetical protein
MTLICQRGYVPAFVVCLLWQILSTALHIKRNNIHIQISNGMGSIMWLRQYAAKSLARFDNPQEAIEELRSNGFDWALLHDIFRYDDRWLSEGQYEELLTLALASISSDKGRSVLLKILDLQYVCLLENESLRGGMLEDQDSGKIALSGVEPEESYLFPNPECMFGERIVSYLAINAREQFKLDGSRNGAFENYSKLPPGTISDHLCEAYSRLVSDGEKK